MAAIAGNGCITCDNVLGVNSTTGAVGGKRGSEENEVS